MASDELDAGVYHVRLTHEELLKVRISLINTAKYWEEQGDDETAQLFRGLLEPFAFERKLAKDE